MSEHHGSPRVEGHHVQVRLHQVGVAGNLKLEKRRPLLSSFSRVTDGARCCYYSIYVISSLATISSLAVGVHFLGIVNTVFVNKKGTIIQKIAKYILFF